MFLVRIPSLGSSPRVWGQGRLPSYLYESARIIPTRVGTSMLVSGEASLTEDHPHACGDKVEQSPSCEGLLGSSPRVWGQEQD